MNWSVINHLFFWLMVIPWGLGVLLIFGNQTGIGVAFSYSIEDEKLVVRARFLGMITYFTGRIALSEIEECRPFITRKDLFPGCWIWGILLSEWWTLVLRRKRIHGFRKVIISPGSAAGSMIADAVNNDMERRAGLIS